MKTAKHTIVSYVLFLIGITASLMALKGINQYFSALIRLTKTKFATLVTSNTDKSNELGAFGTVKYDALSGISLPCVLQSKIFCVKMWATTSDTSVQNFMKRSPHDEKLYHMEYFHPWDS